MVIILNCRSQVVNSHSTFILQPPTTHCRRHRWSTSLEKSRLLQVLLFCSCPLASLMLQLCQLPVSYYRPPKKLRKGNVFTPVCDSVHRGGYTHTSLGRHPPADTTLGRHPPPQADSPQGRPLQRTVGILLECILMLFKHLVNVCNIQ